MKTRLADMVNVLGMCSGESGGFENNEKLEK